MAFVRGLEAAQDFIAHAWEVLDDERLAQGLTHVELSTRMGLIRQNYTRRRMVGADLRVSTVARMAHAMGKRVRLVLVDEVEEVKR